MLSIRWFCLASALALGACKDNNPKKTTPAASASSIASVSATATASAAPKPISTTVGATPAPRGATSETPASHVHMPAKCDIAMQINIVEVLAHPTVKAEVVPNLEASLTRQPTNPGAQGARTFLDKSGIKPLTDLKTFSFCAQQPISKKPTFVATLGGNLARNAVAQAVVEAMPKQFQLLKLAGVDAALAGKAQFIGQASDGVIVIANAKTMFEAGTKVTEGAKALELPVDKTLALLINGATLKNAAKNGQGGPFDAHLAKAERLQLVADTGAGGLEARIRMPDATAAAEFGGALKAAIQQAGTAKLPGIPAAFTSMLKNTKVKYSERELVLTLKVSEGDLKQLVQTMGRMMAGASRRPSIQIKPSPPSRGF